MVIFINILLNIFYKITKIIKYIILYTIVQTFVKNQNLYNKRAKLTMKKYIRIFRSLIKMDHAVKAKQEQGFVIVDIHLSQSPFDQPRVILRNGNVELLMIVAKHMSEVYLNRISELTPEQEEERKRRKSERRKKRKKKDDRNMKIVKMQRTECKK